MAVLEGNISVTGLDHEAKATDEWKKKFDTVLCFSPQPEIQYQWWF